MLFAFVVLWCAAPMPRAMAALVAPHAIFIDHQTRSGVFYVHNPSHEPVEVTVDLVFGYPASDESGVVRVVYFPEPDPEAPSAAGFVRALPRRMIVPPGKRQAVRLLARPPAGLPDGEYWSRIMVTSQAQSISTTAVDGSGNVRVGLRTATRTVTSLNYRKGELATDVAVRSFTAELHEHGVIVDVDLERRGTAAFLGRMEIQLIDAQGVEAYSFDRSVAVYYELFRRLEIPTVDLPAGEYELRLRLSTERLDLAADHIYQAPEQRFSLPITLGDDGPTR